MGEFGFEGRAEGFGDGPLEGSEAVEDAGDDALALFFGEGFDKGFGGDGVGEVDEGIDGEEADGFVVVGDVGEEGAGDVGGGERFGEEDELFFAFGVADVVGADFGEEFGDKEGEVVGGEEFAESAEGPVNEFIVAAEVVFDGIDSELAHGHQKVAGHFFFVAVDGEVFALGGEAFEEDAGGVLGTIGAELIKKILSIGGLDEHIGDFLFGLHDLFGAAIGGVFTTEEKFFQSHNLIIHQGGVKAKTPWGGAGRGRVGAGGGESTRGGGKEGE